MTIHRVPLHRSFATRSFIRVVVLFSFVLLAVLGWAVLRNLHQERSAVESRAGSQARFLATVGPEAMFFRDFLTLETLVREAVKEPGIVHAVFIDTNGAPMTRYVRFDDPPVESALSQLGMFDSAGLVDALTRQASLSEILVPVISEDVRLGEVRLVYSVEGAKAAAFSFFIQAGLVAALALAVITFATLLVFRRSVQRPLHLLTSRVERLGRERFADVPAARAVARVDEIGMLEDAFNDMARDLEATVTGLERAKDEAERADQTKSEFLANMSHEIRTPLNAVLGFADVLLDSELTADQRVLLTTMHESGEALLMILNEVLDFSKLENNGSELDLDRFALASVVSSAVALFSAEASRKNIRLDYEISGGCPAVVLGDEGRVRQVLVNLIGNAVKFTDLGGVQLAVTPAGTADRIRFEVTDTGIGIDPELSHELFEPFTQGDSTTTRRFGGTGLGLAICHRLIDLMGGTIEAVGQVGVGSTFSFELPLVAQEACAIDELAPSDPVAEISAADHPLRVLLAEDNATNRMVATRMFSRLGYEVDVAHDGVEAVDLACAAPYDLVLMDIQMPRLGGVEAAQRIRANFADRLQPSIVAFTAHALAGDRDHFLSSGMDGYLTKPLRLEQLKAVLASTPSLTGPHARPDVSSDDGADFPTGLRHRAGVVADMFDFTELERLFGEDADELFVELLPTFCSDARKQVSSMRQALDAQDAQALSRAAHALKGSARTMAATQVAARCDRLERLGSAGNVGAATALVDDMEADLARLS